MPDHDPIEHRLTELEIKSSFAEDTLDRLSEVLVRQQQQIERLERELSMLRAQAELAAPAAAGNPRDELPPHY